MQMPCHISYVEKAGDPSPCLASPLSHLVLAIFSPLHLSVSGTDLQGVWGAHSILTTGVSPGGQAAFRTIQSRSL